jgi:hypothetical protein
MAKEQQEDLLIEWGLYEPRAQQSMIYEYNFLTGDRDRATATFWTSLRTNLRF